MIFCRYNRLGSAMTICSRWEASGPAIGILWRLNDAQRVDSNINSLESIQRSMVKTKIHLSLHTKKHYRTVNSSK